MIYILDTDILTFLLREDSVIRALVQRRIVDLPASDIVTTTIINYEELVRGWMSILSQAKSPADEISAYDRLLKQFEFFKEFKLLPYDAPAVTAFGEMRKRRIRIGSMDLKIAAIAQASGATVITRNSIDFSQIPDLLIQDWSVE